MFTKSCVCVCMCVCESRYFAGLLLGCLQGVSKEELLSSRYCPVPNHYEEKSLVSSCTPKI